MLKLELIVNNILKFSSDLTVNTLIPITKTCHIMLYREVIVYCENQYSSSSSSRRSSNSNCNVAVIVQ